MATKIVALDAGHGLKTAGKQTPDGIKEWTLNDKVRDKVVAMLKDYNVKFIFPDNNEGNVDEALAGRRTMYVNQKVDAAVSIHHNAYKGTWCTATGVEIYTDKNATAAQLPLEFHLLQEFLEVHLLLSLLHIDCKQLLIRQLLQMHQPMKQQCFQSLQHHLIQNLI